MTTLRGTINRTVALRVVVLVILAWAFWQAAQPTPECTQWGKGNAVESAMPASGLVQVPVTCQH